MTRHRLDWKKGQLEEIKALCKAYPVIGIADLSGFPAPLFQVLRKQLSGTAVFRVSKINVIKRALKESRLDKLENVANKSCALLFTKNNPFELFATLKKNKGNAPAKPGMIAPIDIIVPAGDTGLPPGPALSDLKAAGLAVRVQGATIFIAEDKVVTKAGAAVLPAVASTLAKLNIKPIKVGLNLIAAYEGGELYTREVLDIDVDKLFSDFAAAHLHAFALSMEIAYPTAETMPLLIRKAAAGARSVALKAAIFTEETMPALLARADAAASALKSNVHEPAEDVGAEAKLTEDKGSAAKGAEDKGTETKGADV